MLKATELALGIAFVTAALELWLKLISRPPVPGRRTGLNIEDAVFWVDWVAAGTVALVSFLAVAATTGAQIRLSQVGIAVASLIFGYSVLPYAMRQFGYDKNGKAKIWPYILIGNIMGGSILFAAVVSGACHIILP